MVIPLSLIGNAVLGQTLVLSFKPKARLKETLASPDFAGQKQKENSKQFPMWLNPPTCALAGEFEKEAL